MMLSKIKEFLILGSGILLLGMVSCKKAAEEQPSQEARPARVSLTAQVGSDTKAGYLAGKVSWEVGDQLVLHDGTQVLGTLQCISADASGKGSFTGEVASFSTDPSYTVNVWFLGNRSVSSNTLTVDFSSQNGTPSGVSSYIFLLKEDVVFNKGEDTYSPSSTISFAQSFNAIMELRMSGANGPDEQPGNGLKAKKITIEGLKNQLTLDLAAKSATADYANAAPYATTVAPSSVSQYSDVYYLSVIPDAANNSLNITSDYQDGGTGTFAVGWKGVNWSSMVSGNWYYTDWTSKTAAQYSSKVGYNGQAVTGGETADGKDGKSGYNGANADGTDDNPTGNKGGYNGTEVLQ
ncbi:MAG: hypothetical protein K5651_08580 [Bacteroidales bacterium]|nr:hypothetical protein [Bacteroidales bacterium]